LLPVKIYLATPLATTLYGISIGRMPLCYIYGCLGFSVVESPEQKRQAVGKCAEIVVPVNGRAGT